MNLDNAQQAVDQWIKNHGVRYFDELTNMAQLTEEVGEVARIIARRYGEQSEKESDKEKDLGEELADVLFVVLCLANQTGVDLSNAFVSIWHPGTSVEGINDVIFSNKNNSINYDFTGKLPYSWPSRLSINPLNVGAKNYSPLFEYGYGLSYQD